MCFNITCFIFSLRDRRCLISQVLLNSALVITKWSKHSWNRTWSIIQQKSYLSEVPNTKVLDPEALRADVSSRMRTLELDTCESSQEQYNRWHNALTDVLDRHMPIKKLLKSQRNGRPLYHQRMRRSYQKKRESTRSVVGSYTPKKATSCGRSGAILRPALEKKAIKQYWTERSDELRTNPDAPSSKRSRHFWEIKVVVNSNSLKGRK